MMKARRLRVLAPLLVLTTAGGALGEGTGLGTSLATEASILHLIDLAAHPMATCLDGSPGAFYHWGSPAGASEEDRRRWIIWHVGGGWCSLHVPDNQSVTVDSCYSRSFGFLGSSSSYKDGQPPGWNPWGIEKALTEDPATNPMMAGWNKIAIVYCDGGSFSGRAEVPLTVNGRQLYFRGNYILEAVIETLLNQYGLGDATDVVVAGSSAGGLATYLHAEQWRRALPSSAFVVAMPDGGFFLDWSSTKPVGAAHSYAEELRADFADFNASAGVNQACVAARTGAGGDPADCFFAEHTAPFISVPLFALQSVVDSWQLGNELGNNLTDPVNGYRTVMASKLLDSVFTGARRGGFVDSCVHHCAGWGLKIRGMRQADAFTEWYSMQRKAWEDGAEATQALSWWQGNAYPCADCCMEDDAAILLV